MVVRLIKMRRAVIRAIPDSPLINRRPWLIFPSPQLVPPQHSLGKGVLTLLAGVGVDVPGLRRQGNANCIGVRLREAMARNKVGEGLVHTTTCSISQDVIGVRGTREGFPTGNDIERVAVRRRNPGARYGQLCRGIGADAACLPRTSTSDDPDRVSSGETARGPRLPGITQSGSGVAIRGVAHVL